MSASLLVQYGGGAMACAGEGLANLELAVAVAHVVRNFNLKTPTAPDVNMNFAASFKTPLVMQFELRRNPHDEL